MDNTTITAELPPGSLKTSEELYHNDPYIEIQSGLWHLNNPYYEIGDIAHNLAQMNRYTGAANFPYNVAEHSVLVSLLMQHEVGGDPFEGLLHDASEAYLADISSPMKGELHDYKRLEARIEGGIRDVFDLPEIKSKECKEADYLALFIEAHQLMPSRGAHYHDPYNFKARAAKLRDAGWRIHGFDWVRSQQLFMQRYNELRFNEVPRRAVTLLPKSR